MKILLIEPFYAGSHKTWADNLKKYSSHTITLLTLSGHYWKWRMHGGAITLAKKFKSLDQQFDLIICSDMLDLSTFQALTKALTWNIPFVLYFHENQLMYPREINDEDVRQQRDRHYGFINYNSALCADHIFFNSHFHRTGFLNELPNFLKGFPDHNELKFVKSIEQKSFVLPLFLDLKALDKFKLHPKIENEPPIILWNHRWEYDKNPQLFFSMMIELKKEGYEFQLVVLGQKFNNTPAIFNEAKQILNEQILHWGFADSHEEYGQWLWRSDLIPVTSNQDFFGGSLIEAMYCETIPLLPNRLVFPEHLPQDYHQSHLYHEHQLSEKLRDLLLRRNTLKPVQFRRIVEKYDCQELINTYDRELENIRVNF